MAADGQIRERVYREIKRKLVEGEIALDQHLDIKRLSRALKASPTPVKEALVRLVGERLLVAKGKGFQVARWTAGQLRSLYEWRQKLLVLALEQCVPSALPAANISAGYALQVRQLFEAVEAAGGDELAYAAANADDRLGYARLVEPELWIDVIEELEGLRAALTSGERAIVIESVRRYFARRIGAAQAIRDRAVIRSNPNGG